MIIDYNLPIYKIKFLFVADEEMNLPRFKGSMFRGAFGSTFRKVVCVTKLKECNDCFMQQQCSYFSVFETELPKNDIPFLDGVKKMPHPFIIHPSEDLEKTYFVKGETVTVGFSIFSDYIKLLPYFVYTFMEMGKKGIGYKRAKLTLNKVLFLLEDGTETELLSPTGKLTAPETPTYNPSHNYSEIESPNKIKLIFKTPLRIQDGGVVLFHPEKLTPKILTRGFFRRYFAVLSLYGKTDKNDSMRREITEDEIIISDNNLQFLYMERYSSRQKTTMGFGGFIGDITLSGNLSKIYPIIKAVEKFNLGKNTAFGYGEFATETLS